MHSFQLSETTSGIVSISGGGWGCAGGGAARTPPVPQVIEMLLLLDRQRESASRIRPFEEKNVV